MRVRRDLQADKLRVMSWLKILAGTWLIAAGWSWYHVWKHPKWAFVGKALLVWFAVAAVYLAGKQLYHFLVRRFKLGSFWENVFDRGLDSLLLIASMLFVIFFITNEIITLLYSVFIFWLIFRTLQKLLSQHENALELLRLNRAIFILAAGLFVIQSVWQYAAFHYYILDSNIQFFDIVFFRATALTVFWLGGFMVGSMLFVRGRHWSRAIPLIIWTLLFVLMQVVWMFNLGILYYSGLYISPVALEHAEGSGGVVFNSAVLVFVGAFVAACVVFFVTFWPLLKAHRRVSKRYIYFYGALAVLLAFVVVVAIHSLRNTPEAEIAVSFYDAYLKKEAPIQLNPAINAKLAKFGLHYEPNSFYVNDRSQVFTPTTTPLLPPEFAHSKPNIVFIYVESFSARFAGVYNPAMTGVTPNFDAFADDPHTTVFYNYYNASTPTITGTLSQQCSFLPPTGENEIETEKKLQSHRLLCLPEVLKKDAGYKYAAYITAVAKTFAHKDGIFESMDVNDVFGTAELANYIKGPPLAWGYSDHQMFPVLWQFMQTAPQPFDYMLQTIDTHPPFNLAEDAIPYGDGHSDVLNMFHTTDNAFGKFWDEFKASPFYHNTIVVVVADHAIFPGAVTSDLFPTDAGKLTYYDKNFFAMYIPDSVLPKRVDVMSSGIDVMPTLLQILNINIPNSFEGHSIFDDQSKYPNILGMHELGLYINQLTASGTRKISYDVPSDIQCPANYSPTSTSDFTECDYLQFYEWKRQMFQEGRFWKHWND